MTTEGRRFLEAGLRKSAICGRQRWDLERTERTVKGRRTLVVAAKPFPTKPPGALVEADAE